ncbi:MAG TPA: Eco57I restriction-modification methylase domain-containing protein, partial [Pyrinomonadaceae bacterium]
MICGMVGMNFFDNLQLKKFQMKPETYKFESDLRYLNETAKSLNNESKQRGAIYTRPEVVNLILDLAGYTVDRSLHKMRILEPSFGEGSFVVSIIERLLQSYKSEKKDLSKAEVDLEKAVRAVELHPETFQNSRNKIVNFLEAQGLTENQSMTLVNSWLICGDFLLEEFENDFTHVVGNPPYVRQELIPTELIREYRKLFKTIFDRADIYIPFIEKSLSLLEKQGTLGFICSDRWIKNRYGQPLRRLINEKFFLKYHIDMNDTPAFHSDVIAYPAITVIQNAPPGKTSVLSYLEIKNRVNAENGEVLNGFDAIWKTESTHNFAQIKSTNEPWILHANGETKLIQRLEKEFPCIEMTNCKIGIGVATGADKVYIAKFDEIDVETDRKLPIVMTRDIKTGKVIWRGYGVIN